ncbi:Fis family transcriptional regulator [Candidatus Fermentibacteria bacterium]|nr:MAG: Fis family transcriptional regulator [Candidatus Fermentibacteria bacterium]PIE52831.1 MAG: Fis family transcriptional regulator [Candidatus Fermentibacteria bacterium]
METITEAILESISEGVFAVDRQWRITSFNRAAEEITGIPRAEALGRQCSEVFRSSMCEVACALRKSMCTGKPVRSQAGYIVNALGDRIPVSVSTAVLVDENGNVSGGAETFRDMSVVERLKDQLNSRYGAGDLVSRSSAMQSLFRLMPAVASSPSTVLLQGETGTGKEVFARAIHSEGPRASEPFIGVNCGALPDTLLESELFGYRKGAFTGAERNRDGVFISAGKGTLFLDEIGEISPAMQVRLLRVLQERAVTPLGTSSSLPVSARVICATNRDLYQMVEEGRFRSDLYYRINVVRMVIPPLRERSEDIPLLLKSLLEKHCLAQGRDTMDYDPALLPLLIGYSWPGNVRELENLVERAILLTSGNVIGLDSLPPEILPQSACPSSSTDLRSAREEAEKSRILAALSSNNFNREAAARELEVHKTTLYRRMKTLGIPLPEVDGRSSKAT